MAFDGDIELVVPDEDGMLDLVVVVDPGVLEVMTIGAGGLIVVVFTGLVVVGCAVVVGLVFLTITSFFGGILAGARIGFGVEMCGSFGGRGGGGGLKPPFPASTLAQRISAKVVAREKRKGDIRLLHLFECFRENLSPG
jgi:hypothetical protein